ncbi:MAG: cell division protein SepF [Clostridia bacterium]|nr:cell division protein SepF [Clostridia bacterium]
MANGNFFKDAFGKAKQRLEGFLYRDDAAMTAPMPAMNEERYPAPETMYPQQNPTAAYAQQAPAAYAQQNSTAAYGQQGVYQQPQYAAPQNMYTAQTPYAQQPYQQPAQPQQAQQPTAQHAARNRRADRTPFQQPESNVVDFAAYQQGQPNAEAAQQPVAAAVNARIINARGMGDCRSAITLLRNGDSVLIVLENVTDPAEMRRLVDTLSGACYSLTATITKVSRYGVYLLAPQSMAVYADQATNQMNMAPTRAAARTAQPAYGAPAQRPQYQQSPYQQAAPQNPYAQNAYAAPQQGGFTQRAAAPEESAQPFYARTAPQNAQIPAFATQPAGYGYAPDEGAAVDQ